MLISPYKIKHWYPVKKIPVGYDGWWNVTEYEEVEKSASSFFIFLFCI